LPVFSPNHAFLVFIGTKSSISLACCFFIFSRYSPYALPKLIEQHFLLPDADQLLKAFLLLFSSWLILFC
jgi:hypothetical protein